MTRAGVSFLDKQIYSDYEKRNKSLIKENLTPIQIQYLYMRSYFPEIEVPQNIFSALNYYRKISVQEWTKESDYMQAMIALLLKRTGDSSTANEILASLKENAIHAKELGMYCKSVGDGYYWQEAPVETQSVLIEAFQEIPSNCFYLTRSATYVKLPIRNCQLSVSEKLFVFLLYLQFRSCFEIFINQ